MNLLFVSIHKAARAEWQDVYKRQVPEVATSLTSSSRTISVHLYCLLNEGLYTEQAYATAVVLIKMCIRDRLGEESFKDGVDVFPQNVYDFVAKTGTLPKTCLLYTSRCV